MAISSASNPYLVVLFTGVVAALCTYAIQPKLVKLARVKRIVDKPNSRRLNIKAIPVLGGVGVYMGTIVSLAATTMIYNCTELFVPVLALSIIVLTGFVDDASGLSARYRLIIQAMVVVFLMLGGGFVVNNFYGLWDLYSLPSYVAYPLTLFACVGMINAINLMDGVDGLSSGFGIVASLICGVQFMLNGDTVYAVLAFAVVGALVPFFSYNVFGKKYKMFIGDAGSLFLGVAFSIFILRLISTPNFNMPSAPVAFVLAIFAVPLFDTVRVMSMRIAKGRSPFSPDKTHLHHVFIHLGFKHVYVSAIVLFLSLFVFGVWVLAEYVGLSPELQLYCVVACGLGATWGIWIFVNYVEQRSQARFKLAKSVISQRWGVRQS